MATTWQTARVFISSTFRDMHAERDHLIKVVFPELRERLLPHRIELIDIDLRWGITEEEAKRDRVLDLCLELIEECRPFFLGILGERYGWVTKTFSNVVKAKYGWVQCQAGKSVTELEMLFGVLLLMDPQMKMKGKSFFYFRNPKALDNVPQPIRSEVYVETDPVLIAKLTALKKKIRNVRDQGYPVFDGYPAHWTAAATNRLAIDEIYKAGRLEGLEAFGRRVKRDLWRGLCRQYPEIRRRRRLQLQRTQPEPTPVDPWAEERDIQERFIHSRLGVFVGREKLYRDLETYADGSSEGLCLLTGPGGSGKSATLAKFVTDYPKSHGDVVVIAHFIGASPRSASLRDMLQRLCRELYERVLRTEHAARLASVTGTGEEAEKARQIIEREYTIPHEISPLVTTWRNFLKQIPKEHRVVIVLDALNQLEETDRARELWWLPRDLEPHIKVAVSTIGDTEALEADGDPVARAFAHRDKTHLRMEPLTDVDRRAIIRQVPSIAAKTLSDSQVEALLANPATDNPLYLRVALEELRGFGLHEKLDTRIAALPGKAVPDEIYKRAGFKIEAMRQAGDPVTALFTQVIQRLETDFSLPVVHDVLTLIASARRGLSERELKELVAGSPDSDDLFPILRQLRPYLVSRNGLLGFFHGNLLQAVQRYYLATEDARKAGHIRLAEFFEKQDPWWESLEEQQARSLRFPPTSRPANVRRAEELVWQWLEAERWDDVSRTLKDVDFTEAKAEAGYVFDLVMDFTRSVERITVDHGAHRQLRLLEQALRSDLHFLARHPTTLFQCLWNRCWWYDCPDAAAHYDPPSGGWPDGGPPWSRPAPERLSTLMNSWRAAKQRRSLGFVWLRSLRPPPVPLGSGMLALLTGQGAEEWVHCVAWSPDGRWLVSASSPAFQYSGPSEGTVRLWDPDSGREILPAETLPDTVFGVAWSPDSRKFAIATDNGLVRVRDVDSRDPPTQVAAHAERVWCIAWSGDGRWIATGSSDKTVRVWDAETLHEMAALEGHTEEVTSIAWSRDRARLVSGSGDRTIRIWDAMNRLELARFESGDDEVTSVAWSRVGDQIASGSYDKVVRIWSPGGSSQPLVTITGDVDVVDCVAWSPTEDRLAGGSCDMTIRIWDSGSGRELLRFEGHGTRITTLTWSPDGHRIASGGSDGAIRIWDAHAEPRS
ncbi:MAG: AAA family ATPase, partial [Isosphaeraceae bacterium]